MSNFALVPSDMAAASGAVTGAAADARGADGSDALGSLASALPGSTTAEIMPDLGDAWESGLNDWSDAASGFASSLERTTQDSTTTDGATGGLFDFLRGSLGGR